MSVIFSFLIGCGVGVLGHYFWLHSKSSGQDRGSFSKKKNRKNEELLALFAEYPYLMNLIKSNISDPEYKDVREFFVVDKSALMNSSIPRLRYDLSDELLSLLLHLERLKYIDRLEHDSLLYRMSDEFIFDLKSSSPPELF